MTESKNIQIEKKRRDNNINLSNLYFKPVQGKFLYLTINQKKFNARNISASKSFLIQGDLIKKPYSREQQYLIKPYISETFNVQDGSATKFDLDSVKEKTTTDMKPIPAANFFGFFSLVLTSTILYLLSSEPLGDLATLGIIISFAWLVYGYIDGKRRMWRHAILTHVMMKDSQIRETLWESSISKCLHIIFSLASAISVFLIMNRLQDEEWLLLFFSLFTFYGLFFFFDRKLSSEIVSAYHVFIALSMAYWINLILMLLISAFYYLYFADFVDTRSLALVDVASNAFKVASDQTHSDVMGGLFGIDAILKEGSLHVMQVITTEIEVSASYKLLAWIIFFALMAMQYGFLWLILMGSLVFAIRIRQQGWTFFVDSGMARPAMITLVGFILVISVGYQASRLSVFEKQDTLPEESGQVDNKISEATEIPCFSGVQLHQLDALEKSSNKQLKAIKENLKDDFDQHISSIHRDLMRNKEDGVEKFLDWNFSTKAQYEMLLYWLLEHFPNDVLNGYENMIMIEREIIYKLFEISGFSYKNHGSMQDLIESNFSDNISSNMEGSISGLQDVSHELLSNAFSLSDNLVESSLYKGISINPECFKGKAPEINLSSYFEKRYTGLGSVALASSAALAINRYRGIKDKTGKHLFKNNRISKKIAKKQGSKIAGKLVASITSKFIKSGTAASAGTFCGPAAPACATGFFIATFVGSEMAINAIDEALRREKMKAEIMAEFDREIDSALEEIRKLIIEDIDEAFNIKKEYLDKRFNAYRDSVLLSS